jgi:hypothetical protein
MTIKEGGKGGQEMAVGVERMWIAALRLVVTRHKKVWCSLGSACEYL